MLYDIIKRMTNHVIDSTATAHNLLSVSDFQRAPGKALRRLRDSRTSLIITQRGRPVAVLSAPTPPSPGGTAPTTTASPAVSGRHHALLTALQKMLPAIIEHYAPEKIVLFGSLATGQVHEASDIDLMIVRKTTKRWLDRQRDIMRIADPEIATDFFVYTPAELAQGIHTRPHFFQDEILAKGQVLYEKG